MTVVDAGTVISAILLLLGILGFSKIASKLRAILEGVTTLISSTQKESVELLQVINTALADNKVSDEEIKLIIAEAKDVPNAVKTAIENLKTLVKNAK